MTTKKKEIVKPTNLQYFQNLIPGVHNSPFIKRYQDECLNEENDQNTEERGQLLNISFPPVLSFYEKQQKEFYEKEAQNCQQFCCGSMGLNESLSSDAFLEKKDNYMLSIGNGKLYEGSFSTIKEEMKQNVQQKPFGSDEQEELMTGLKEFESKVTQREQPNPSPTHSEINEAGKQDTPNPF